MTHDLDMAQSAGPLSQRLLAIRQHVASRESGVPAADKNPELLSTITAIAGTPKTPRAVLTFPALTRLSDGRILASCRAGTTKDSADETVLLAESTDDGCTFSEPWQPYQCGSDGKAATVTVTSSALSGTSSQRWCARATRSWQASHRRTVTTPEGRNEPA